MLLTPSFIFNLDSLWFIVSLGWAYLTGYMVQWLFDCIWMMLWLDLLVEPLNPWLSHLAEPSNNIAGKFFSLNKLSW